MIGKNVVNFRNSTNKVPFPSYFLYYTTKYQINGGNIPIEVEIGIVRINLAFLISP